MLGIQECTEWNVEKHWCVWSSDAKVGFELRRQEQRSGHGCQESTRGGLQVSSCPRQ